MEPLSAIAAFSVAAALLTVTPGLDTALVLRTAAVEGSRPAFLAGLGISAGSASWGVATAIGLTALLALSELAYLALKVAGAVYLVWLGAGMFRNAFFGVMPAKPDVDAGSPATGKARNWFLRGMATNLCSATI